MHDTQKPETAETEPNSEQIQEARSDAQLRRWIAWIVLTSFLAFAIYFCGFLVYHSLWGATTSGNWLLTLFEKHYAGVVGTPMCAIAAFCIVTLLKVTNGPIEFEAVGFKFRGASGPIVLWIFCFLAMSVAFNFLWSNVD